MICVVLVFTGMDRFTLYWTDQYLLRVSETTTRHPVNAYTAHAKYNRYILKGVFLKVKLNKNQHYHWLFYL